MRDLGRELEDRKRPVTLFFLFKTLEAPKSWVRLRCKRTISDAKKKKNWSQSTLINAQLAIFIHLSTAWRFSKGGKNH